MTPFNIFRRRKKETEEIAEKKVEEKTLLEELCKGDNQLLRAMSRTLLLNLEMTKKAGEVDARIESAQEFEKKQDFLKARIEYQVAGELALYEGNTAQVQKFFKKAAEVDPTYPNKDAFEFLAKKENAEKAVAIAKEYYARTAEPTY